MNNLINYSQNIFYNVICILQIYAEENKNPFPDDLAELCDIFANYLGYKSFKAQAAIVNYYHMGSTLSAHTDHSEVNLEAPLFSFRLVYFCSFSLESHFILNNINSHILNVYLVIFNNIKT